MIDSKLMGELQGKGVYLFHFANSAGMTMNVTNYGATLTSVKVPDKNGDYADVVLGLDSVDDYMAGHPYMGSTVGRFANRIGGARFTLNGKAYELTPTEGKNQLHGGVDNFSKKVWDHEVDGDTLKLTYVSRDGEEGYPGSLTVEVRYTLTDGNAVDISYRATSGADTVINLTNHSYFNLNGMSGPMLGQVMEVFAQYYTPTDSELIPTGEIAPVAGTPLDFNQPRKIGERIFEDSFPSIKICGGYDNNFVIDGSGMRRAATLYDTKSGRFMEVITDQPGMQVYTSQGLPEGFVGRDGKTYGPFYGVCFETQGFPDAPNKPAFPSAILKAGDEYTHHTEYVFSVK